MDWFREVRWELSYMVFALGLVLSFLAFTQAFRADFGVRELRELHQGIGNWGVWLEVVGPLLVLGGGWYFIDILRKRRELNGLLATDSKAQFVRNVDRIEYLAWYLTLDDEKRVTKRKRELGIQR